MALIDYIMLGFPKVSVDQSGTRTQYRFKGPTATLTPLIPDQFADFGGSLVDKTSLEPLEKSTYCEVTVETLTPTLTSATISNDQYPFYEIDWVQVEKVLRNHPAFDSLSDEDWTKVDAWEAEKKNSIKKDFQYFDRDEDGSPVGSAQTLPGSTTSGAQLYARLRLRGVEAFLDFAPIARKTSKSFGTAAPSTSDAGQKIGGDPFTGVPGTYEWVKTADSSSKQGTDSSVWLRREEWQGSRQVLLDKDDVFLT